MVHIKELVQFHGALADPLRLRIVRLLLERELCVCEITRVIKAPQYKVSRHLSVLKKAGLLRGWREGTWVHYEINPLLPARARKALAALSVYWDTCPEVNQDVGALGRGSRRPPGGPVVCAD